MDVNLNATRSRERVTYHQKARLNITAAAERALYGVLGYYTWKNSTGYTGVLLDKFTNFLTDGSNIFPDDKLGEASIVLREIVEYWLVDAEHNNCPQGYVKELSAFYTHPPEDRRLIVRVMLDYLFPKG